MKHPLAVAMLVLTLLLAPAIPLLMRVAGGSSAEAGQVCTGIRAQQLQLIDEIELEAAGGQPVRSQLAQESC